MKLIEVEELKKMMDEGQDFQIIDCREPHEYEIVNIGAELIPMQELAQKPDAIATDKPVIIHCRSGKRSATVIKHLESQGAPEMYNLSGGILAWVEKIDPSLSSY